MTSRKPSNAPSADSFGFDKEGRNCSVQWQFQVCFSMKMATMTRTALRGSLLLILAACATYSACSATRVVYRDFANGRDLSSSALIENSSYIVVGIPGEKLRSGPHGLVPRPNRAPDFPAQRYRFTLKVRRTLRGDLHTGETISVLGYETEDLVLIGPPQGICGRPGELGIYFLRKENGSFRVMVDNLRVWIPLDQRTDLRVVEPNDAMGVSIWRLTVYPFQAGLLQSTQEGLLKSFIMPLADLGTSRSAALFSEAMEHSDSPSFQVEACIALNAVNRGFGLEGCALRLRNQDFLTTAQCAELEDILARVPAANAKVELLLESADWRLIGFWARGHDLKCIREFLILLSRHPDRKIARLATALLSRRPNV